eukprot:CAMPEP_0181320958 /NCGR_PEP_ID=MMETSP1101-20121128/18412_1 /TAXON_ID=46948 /ORGANISM="Rhodomonas abbreviata, Strain Caron Lab Isolate" /LENGTH=104 /DNA_ID=CAMNT_0023428719 /DNA_START=724 /DNA_END=1038 /DNA_ORIENTATION=+
MPNLLASDIARQNQVNALLSRPPNMTQSERCVSVPPTGLDKFESYFGCSLSEGNYAPVKTKRDYHECMFDPVFGGQVNASYLCRDPVEIASNCLAMPLRNDAHD